ncbi:hypothetical protein P1J78_02145 [Psychromarinibacter sp. C21-152]|uniref:Uncharacterized protein n=1 Tax=Psychromarinibacter sediminicola TaxID=3033385 RepID=A0AAE3NPD0_9RHOB|nr:hypothetical protein [Psychromarinibacter sediminicola]MDF0599521.1 hypothetical protein [Psychromarinibacter sediminicola]
MTPLRRITHAAKLAHAYLTQPRGSAPLALHGIQRSGTNYADACLRRMRVRPVNQVVPLPRDDPRHKHFRWYADKSAIPAFLRRQFDNDLVVTDVEHLNRAARYRPDCAHVVMQKDRTAWLASACNWGLRMGWFPPEPEAALAELGPLVRDYEAYYAFWSDLAARFPDRVAVLELDALASDLGVLTEALDRLGVRYRRPPGFDGRIEEVPQSPADRARRITPEQVRARLEAG